MNRLIKTRPSPAMLVACAALGIALSGNAGAHLSSKSTVTSVLAKGQVARGSVDLESANCPDGYSVLGGGYVVTSGNIAIPTSAFPSRFPGGYGTGILVPPTQIGAPTQNATFTVKAVCAKRGVPVVLP